MKVRALNSFVDTAHGARVKGQMFELPAGVDWLRAGLVEPVEPEQTAEPSAEPKPKGKRAKKSDA